MKIRRQLLAVPLLAACAATPWLLAVTVSSCSSSSTTGGFRREFRGNGWSHHRRHGRERLEIVTLDASDGGDASDLELAVGPGDVVGVAYFLGQPQPPTADYQPYQIRYVQFSAGVVSAPQIVAGAGDAGIAHPLYDLALAIAPSGQPAVAYQGGQAFGGTAAGSIYWVQSQAMVSYQQPGGTWTAEVADSAAADTPAAEVNACPILNMTDYLAVGPVVLGLYSAIGFDSTGIAYDYFRDVHKGTSIGTSSDLGASTIPGEVGGPANWAQEWAFAGNTWDLAGTPVLGLGSHLRLAMANDQPAMVTDEASQSAGDDSGGLNVDFMARLASTPSSDWSCPQRIIDVGGTQTGPSLAWGSTFGFAVTCFDTIKQELLFTQSKDGVTWPASDQAIDVSDGIPAGWFPSVAINPVTQKPTIADFLCSIQSGPTAISQCNPKQQAIEVRTQSGNSFQSGAVVDPAGGYKPKIGFLSTGKMVIAYRQLPTYNLVLAVQQ